jgi:pyridoxal biosynthesis lyase PdxS
MALEALENLKRTVIEYDTEGAASWAKKIVEKKVDPIKALDALTETIRQVGDRFGRGELWLPDLVGAADAALMMQLGADGVFVGSGIFKSSNPGVRARAIVKATTHFQDPEIIAEVSKNLGKAMPGLDVKQISPEELLVFRGISGN